MIDELKLMDILSADYRGLCTLSFAPVRRTYVGELTTPFQSGDLAPLDRASVTTWLASVLRDHFAAFMDPHLLSWALSALLTHAAELDADIDQAIFVNAHYAFDGTSSVFLEYRNIGVGRGSRVTTYDCSFAAYRASQPDPSAVEEADFHAFISKSPLILAHDLPKISEVTWATYPTNVLREIAGLSPTVRQRP